MKTYTVKRQKTQLININRMEVGRLTILRKQLIRLLRMLKNWPVPKFSEI